ncbi:signal transduction histidine kinase [Vitreoscilla sp. C1]|uniref:sensor histidine kinase n=1 Tax=Vitreoscilla sp. (strain C1) TaxID=96942 RepID=UPI000CDC012D|nr:HAMP domain-containing sensor histidine kinase [Vitreoscilla sp. C1]AUZ04524.1 signal transduction histidine kinase [Vitreoscilla sp. C1]
MVRRQGLGQSLQFRLALIISIVLLIIAVVVSVWSFQRTYNRIQYFQDRSMQTLVSMVQDDNVSLVDADDTSTTTTPHHANPTSSAHKSLPQPPINQLAPPHEQQTIIDTVDNPDLALLFDYPNVNQYLMALPDGFHDLQGKDDTWRAYLLTQTDQRVIVAQPSGFRDEMARKSAWQALIPLLLLLPLLIAAVYITVYQVFKPLRQLTQDLANVEHLQAPSLSERSIPNELQPFTHAVDDLFLRLNDAMQLNRRLIANAAHQLRTPLTALSLQAEQLQQATHSSERFTEQLHQLQQGIHRQRDLVVKLLDLARSEEVLTQQKPQPLSVIDEVTAVMQQCLPIAMHKNIDLGVTHLDNMPLAMSRLDFQTLLQNLVENAVHYTHEDGQVDVAVWQEAQDIVLQVSDNGIGIDDAHKDMVWDAFYRVEDNRQNSTGLGLAIVKNLVERYHGRIYLEDNHPQGLIVTARFSID